jgi:hypothetical protein
MHRGCGSLFFQIAEFVLKQFARYAFGHHHLGIAALLLFRRLLENYLSVLAAALFFASDVHRPAFDFLITVHQISGNCPADEPRHRAPTNPDCAGTDFVQFIMHRVSYRHYGLVVSHAEVAAIGVPDVVQHFLF